MPRPVVRLGSMGGGRKEMVYVGTPVSRGIVFGPVHVVARGFSAPEVYPIANVTRETERFGDALRRTRRQLEGLREHMESLSGNEEGRIFEAHMLVLEDPIVLTGVPKAIEERRQNAEYCFYAVMQNQLESMRRIPDPFLRDRTTDIDDVCQRVLRNFDTEHEQNTPEEPDHQHILVAYDLSPSATAAMDRRQVLGFATEQGSITSHTAILARSLGIPAVVGLRNAVFNLHALDPCILDGYEGKLISNPTPETVSKYRELEEEHQQRRAELDKLRDLGAVTTDERTITLSANIEFEHELDLVDRSGAEGVGLFRTEFFLLESEECPDEEEQAALYSRVAERVAPSEVIFRTLDAGGDKVPGEPLSEPEPNPFLGWRGIRFSLDRQDLFKEQLRAILRAGAAGRVGLMFPLISGVGEVRQAKSLLAECMEELSARGVEFTRDIAVGAMIEVPSAAMVAADIAAEVDFLSIGTNDLVQYTVAVDRVNPRVAKLYRSAHPGIIRLIKTVIDGASQHRIWTGVCGEMAGDLTLLPLLVGLGVDELSVGAPLVPLVKQAVRLLDSGECAELARQCLQAGETKQILQLCSEVATTVYPELIKEESGGASAPSFAAHPS
ncbi:MAG: phosphoenolpyruvate--protein phosphotransferase [Roseibacillus sp.]|nr:phosphoenolpyruvate--protein phosphotransferase [Roseibacillus sp.]